MQLRDAERMFTYIGGFASKCVISLSILKKQHTHTLKPQTKTLGHSFETASFTFTVLQIFLTEVF